MDYLSLLLFFGLVLKSSGFLVRDELKLRGLVALGMCCDILFYALQPVPIWQSVLANVVLASINLILVVFIVFERTTIGLNAESRALFAAFPTLIPGQFRRILKHASWHVADAEVQLATEGAALSELFYVDGPAFEIEKRGKRLYARGPAFVGELVFLNGGASSASVWVAQGTRYIRFDSAGLQHAMDRSGPLRNAMIALFGQDLAKKVANSTPLEGLYVPGPAPGT